MKSRPDRLAAREKAAAARKEFMLRAEAFWHKQELLSTFLAETRTEGMSKHELAEELGRQRLALCSFIGIGPVRKPKTEPESLLSTA